MLVVTSDAGTLQAVIDTAQGNADRLADVAAFRGAMARLPADRLASVYVDISGVPPASAAADRVPAATARPAWRWSPSRAALQLIGSAPFDPATADASTKASFALASEPSSLPDWMPADTEAELVFFGASRPSAPSSASWDRSRAARTRPGAHPAARACRAGPGHRPRSRPAAALRSRGRSRRHQPEREHAARRSAPASERRDRRGGRPGQDGRCASGPRGPA